MTTPTPEPATPRLGDIVKHLRAVRRASYRTVDE